MTGGEFDVAKDDAIEASLGAGGTIGDGVVDPTGKAVAVLVALGAAGRELAAPLTRSVTTADGIAEPTVLADFGAARGGLSSSAAVVGRCSVESVCKYVS